MALKRWLPVLPLALLAAYQLMPDEAEQAMLPAHASASQAPAAPPSSQPVPPPSPPTAQVAPQAPWVASPEVGATPTGPFTPRPRPPAVLAFGAAAPLAAGQDTSGYLWGGVKPDLSD